MRNNPQRILAKATFSILTPLVRILLRNGVSYGVFAEWARKVFVDVANADFAPEGRKQTNSRIAGLTGLTRKEVKRLMELDQGEASEGQARFNRAVRVITGWTSDRRFLDKEKQPRVLEIEGRNSFTTLIKDYSGDMLAPAMLSILEAAGTVRRRGDKVRLVKRAFVPAGDPVDKIRILGVDTAELIETIGHNLATAEAQDLRFQRKVHYDNVTPVATAKFKRVASRKAATLLDDLNLWLAKHGDDGATDNDTLNSVSLGIYYYEDKTETDE